MAREDLKPVRTKEEAKIRGRAGGIASAAARRERKSFEATLKAILDTPMEELESLSPRLAICKGMIMKAAAGDKPAADWVRDTVGEKPVDKQELSGPDGEAVTLRHEVSAEIADMLEKVKGAQE